MFQFTYDYHMFIVSQTYDNQIVTYENHMWHFWQCTCWKKEMITTMIFFYDHFYNQCNSTKLGQNQSQCTWSFPFIQIKKITSNLQIKKPWLADLVKFEENSIQSFFMKQADLFKDQPNCKLITINYPQS